MRRAILITVLAGAGCVAPIAAAERGAISVRVEAARTDVELDLGAGRSAEGDDTSRGARAGYWFTPNFAVEGFYTRFGEASQEIRSINFVSAERIRVDGYGLGAVAKKAFGATGAGFYVAARAGFARISGDVDATLCQPLFDLCTESSANDTSTRPYYGIEVGYDFSPAFGIGAFATRHDFEGDDARDVELESIGAAIEYRF